MVECILIGSGFAFTAAVMPGPLQAFLLSSVAQKGWKRTLPASFAPLISDGPIALLVLLVLNRVPEAMSRILQAAGGVFLVYLAWSGFRQWRQQTATGPETRDSVPRTLIQAVIVNLLNPNVYLSWSLVLGPAFLNAWLPSPANAVALIIAFYATMVAALACTILLFGTTRLLGRSGRRKLILVSAIALAVLGVYLLMASLMKANVV
ncbi:MAG: LysE family transporter [Deltaproteobacteria bacterium]|nr:LysE family transporter [Deltaproteobacteria bacterium]